MARKLDVAIGLMHRPRVLFLDEPTTGLDPEARAEMWAEIARLAAGEQVTVLLTTHYLDEADRLADRLAIVDHGRLVVEGTPEELKRELRGDTVQIELAAAEAAPGARELLAALRGLERGRRPTAPACGPAPRAGRARSRPCWPRSRARASASRRSPSRARRWTTSTCATPGAASRWRHEHDRPAALRVPDRALAAHLWRQPAFAAMTLIQPIIWLLLFGQLFRSVVHLPGFAAGSGSYLEFITPGVIVMTALFSSGWAGTVYIEDMNRGVMDRLLASPVRRGAMMVGTLAYQALTTIVQTLVVFAIAYLAGARFPGAPVGIARHDPGGGR